MLIIILWSVGINSADHVTEFDPYFSQNSSHISEIPHTKKRRFPYITARNAV